MHVSSYGNMGRYLNLYRTAAELLCLLYTSMTSKAVIWTVKSIRIAFVLLTYCLTQISVGGEPACISDKQVHTAGR